VATRRWEDLPLGKGWRWAPWQCLTLKTWSSSIRSTGSAPTSARHGDCWQGREAGVVGGTEQLWLAKRCAVTKPLPGALAPPPPLPHAFQCCNSLPGALQIFPLDAVCLQLPSRELFGGCDKAGSPLGPAIVGQMPSGGEHSAEERVGIPLRKDEQWRRDCFLLRPTTPQASKLLKKKNRGWRRIFFLGFLKSVTLQLEGI